MHVLHFDKIALGSLFGANTRLVVIAAVVIVVLAIVIVLVVISKNKRGNIQSADKPKFSNSQNPSSFAMNTLPIFVSHSHADNAWCRVFVAALKRNGCDVWYDEQGLGGGVIWQKQIVQQLQSRPLFVVVLSPDASASQWVDEEIQLAISSRRKIIPVHHRQTTIEGFLTNRQVVDVRGMDGTRAAAVVAQAARQLIAV